MEDKKESSHHTKSKKESSDKAKSKKMNSSSSSSSSSSKSKHKNSRKYSDKPRKEYPMYSHGYALKSPRIQSNNYKNPVSLAMDVNFGLDNVIKDINKLTRGSFHYPVSTHVTPGYLRNYSSVKKLPCNSIDNKKSKLNTFDYHQQTIHNPHQYDKVSDYGNESERTPISFHGKNRRKKNRNNTMDNPQNHTFHSGQGFPGMPYIVPAQAPYPMQQFHPNPGLIVDPHQMHAELMKLQQEKDQKKEFKEIYEFVKKKEKSKYKAKMDKIIKKLHKANKSVEEAKAKPQQRTVKLQTKKSVGYVNRGLDPIIPPQDDKEISAQPEFREESIEKAVSEKLDEIEQRAKQQHRSKKPYRRIYFRPQGTFAKNVPQSKPLRDITNKYQRDPAKGNIRIYADTRGQRTPIERRSMLKKHERAPVYEREKRIDMVSHNEINSAVNTLMC
ncbi:unnamed protein product [Moneuplotes crassus]|uniref:Uncharacterized protein n=1 Tax=Euplotes crassus TaxID=5936 RepID=A0AAD1UQW8_EUPCR|nr:unnamed protein product [Moneuplotes crassus]